MKDSIHPSYHLQICYRNYLFIARRKKLYCLISYIFLRKKFSETLEYMICDSLDEISSKGFEYIEGNGKPKIILSWIIYLSSIFNADQGTSDSINMMKVIGNLFTYFNILEMERKKFAFCSFSCFIL